MYAQFFKNINKQLKTQLRGRKQKMQTNLVLILSILVFIRTFMFSFAMMMFFLLLVFMFVRFVSVRKRGKKLILVIENSQSCSGYLLLLGYLNCSEIILALNKVELNLYNLIILVLVLARNHPPKEASTTGMLNRCAIYLRHFSYLLANLLDSDLAKGDNINWLDISECIVSRCDPLPLSRLSAEILRFLKVAMGSGS